MFRQLSFFYSSCFNFFARFLKALSAAMLVTLSLVDPTAMLLTFICSSMGNLEVILKNLTASGFAVSAASTKDKSSSQRKITCNKEYRVFVSITINDS